jgi:hypothetical protein
LLTTNLNAGQLAVSAYSTVLAGASQSGGREQAAAVDPARSLGIPAMRESGEMEGAVSSLAGTCFCCATSIGVLLRSSLAP